MTDPARPAITDPDQALLAILRCPVTRDPLTRDAEGFVTPSGRRYPIVDGLPILTPGAARVAGRADQPPAGTDSAGAS